MSKIHDDEITSLLQQGLRAAEVPAPAASFDEKVRERLRRPEPWWRAFLNTFRPIAAPAACSLAVTLAVFIVMGSPKAEGSHSASSTGARNVALEPGIRTHSIDQDLERLDNDTPSLSGFRRRRHSEESEQDHREPPILHRGTSERHLAIGNRA